MLEEEHGTKNHWYNHVSGAGSEHAALPRAVATADLFLYFSLNYMPLMLTLLSLLTKLRD